MKATLLVGVALAALTAAVYGPVATYDFVSLDDPDYVAANPHVAAGLGLAGLGWAFTAFHSGNWHPLTWLSHMLDCELFGLDPGRHHLTSLLLHLANVLLTFAVLRSATASTWRSALVAALFALHPLHVESVAWVSERKDVLSALFGLLALGAWVRYARVGGRLAYLAALLWLALGLLAKPMLVTWPLLFLLLDHWPLGRWATTTTRRLLLEKLPFFLVAATSAAVTLAAQRSGGTMAAGESVRAPLRLLNALVAYGRYLVMTVWPVDLAVLYPHPYLPGGRPLAAWQVAGSIALLAVITALVARTRLLRYPVVGWAWFAITLVPVVGLIQVGVQAVADRYTYLPLTGIFVVLAWAAGDLVAARPRARGAVVAVAIGAVLACAALARSQVGVWKNSETLYARALAVAPTSFLVLQNAGLDLAQRGRVGEAIELHRRALAIEPDSASAHYNLALALQLGGRLAEAIEHYRRAIEIDPGHARSHHNLGVVLLGAGRYQEAAEHFRRALDAKPGLARARAGLRQAQQHLAAEPGP